MSPEEIQGIKEMFGLSTDAELNNKLVDLYNIDEDAATEAFEEMQAQPEQEEQAETFTYEEFKKAFAQVYLHGNEQEIFVLATAKDYNKVVKDVILATEKSQEDKNLLAEFSVYANKAEKDSRKVGIAPANSCYIMPSGTQIRMYDYLAKESEGWWNNLQNELV